LLGNVDDVVSNEDNKDLVSSHSFRYVEVSGAGHGNLVDLDRQAQKAAFTRVLTGEEPGASAMIEPDKTCEQVVFLMHGIRDRGDWTSTLAAQLDEAADRHKPPVKLAIKPYSYGYYPMFRFLFSHDRDRLVRWFVDQYTESCAKYPNARVAYIGHSNGTYIAGAALQKYPLVRLNHVAFAGSVLPRDYDWAKVVARKQVDRVCNDVACGDWVVAFCPRVFEQLQEKSGIRFLNMGSLGSAGYAGFLQAVPHRAVKAVHKDFLNEVEQTTEPQMFEQERKQDVVQEVRYFPGNHGAALVPTNLASLASFVIDGRIPDDRSLLIEGAPEDNVFLGWKLALVLWLTAIAVVLIGGRLWVQLVPWFLGRVCGLSRLGQRQRSAVYYLALAALTAFFLLVGHLPVMFFILLCILVGCWAGFPMSRARVVATLMYTALIVFVLDSI